MELGLVSMRRLCTEQFPYLPRYFLLAKRFYPFQTFIRFNVMIGIPWISYNLSHTDSVL